MRNKLAGRHRAERLGARAVEKYIDGEGPRAQYRSEAKRSRPR